MDALLQKEFVDALLSYRGELVVRRRFSQRVSKTLMLDVVLAAVRAGTSVDRNQVIKETQERQPRCTVNAIKKTWYDLIQGFRVWVASTEWRVTVQPRSWEPLWRFPTGDAVTCHNEIPGFLLVRISLARVGREPGRLSAVVEGVRVTIDVERID